MVNRVDVTGPGGGGVGYLVGWGLFTSDLPDCYR